MPMLPALAGLLALTVVLWWGARRLRLRRGGLAGRDLPPTLMGRLAEPLPDYAQIIAAVGEGRAAPRSLNVTILRTTPGVRVLSLTVSAALLWLAWVAAPGVYIPAGPVTWALSAALGLAGLGVFLFEARSDREALVVTQFGQWRREFLWRHLVHVADDGHHAYVLTFRPGGRVRLPKYLVGMPGLLVHMGQVLDRNLERDAGTA